MQFVLKFFELIKYFFSQHIVFGTGMLLLAGYFAGRIAEKFRLPAITGYILAGLVLSDSVTGIIHQTVALRMTSITEIALGMIAITIGAEFEISRLRKSGLTIMIMTIFQALFAFFFVVIGLVIMKMEFSYALILGAIATATAPAATVVIVKDLRARGEFVDYLYGIVALDDAFCVILFSIIFALVAPALAGTIAGHESTIMSSIAHAGLEILSSCLLGAISGFLLHKFTRDKYRLNEILIISIASIFLTISIAIVLNLSLLIANMMMGAVLVNLSHRNKRIFRVIEPLTPPLFALFFVLAGTELHLYVFTKLAVILFGLMYILARFAGKYMGTWISAFLTKTSAGIRNYLGFCLFPQAGVAIGLVLFVQTSPVLLNAPEIVKETMVFIVNIVLFSIFINELIGPMISKFGIVRGAELE
ncbi:MAG: cation:proton antiporter [Candidatus Marinimicrobia bacterium]|nr:cation:proton antiporter [Candidatus Neomarinimicrobiota bacterium]